MKRSELKDITGQKFGRLTAVENTDKKKNGAYLWLCKCDCGNEKMVRADNLFGGGTQSCGCLYIERFGEGHRLWEVEGTSIFNINQKISKANKSGFKGVIWDKGKNLWKVYITFKGEKKHLGYYVSKQDAINARKEAEEKYFKPILEKYNNEVEKDEI